MGVDADDLNLYALIYYHFYSGGRTEVQSRHQRSALDFEAWLTAGIIVLLGIVPAMLYRWSLKSTALVWFPLLWALRQFVPRNKPLDVRLELFEKSDFNRIVVVFSGIVLFLLVVKLILWNEMHHWSTIWNKSVGGRILAIYIAPGVVEWWQITAACNSILAIGIWLYVRRWLRHLKADRPLRNTVARRLLPWGVLIRTALSAYTISCVAYLYIRELKGVHLPPFGGRFVPWP